MLTTLTTATDFDCFFNYVVRCCEMALGVVADVTREVISDLSQSESDKCFHTLKDFSPVFGVNDVSVSQKSGQVSVQTEKNRKQMQNFFFASRRFIAREKCGSCLFTERHKLSRCGSEKSSSSVLLLRRQRQPYCQRKRRERGRVREETFLKTIFSSLACCCCCAHQHALTHTYARMQARKHTHTHTEAFSRAHPHRVAKIVVAEKNRHRRRRRRRRARARQRRLPVIELRRRISFPSLSLPPSLSPTSHLSLSLSPSRLPSPTLKLSQQQPTRRKKVQFLGDFWGWLLSHSDMQSKRPQNDFQLLNNPWGYFRPRSDREAAKATAGVIITSNDRLVFYASSGSDPNSILFPAIFVATFRSSTA